MQSVSLSSPLTAPYLEELSEFLDKYDLPNLLEIHGFLAAIISGPSLVMPSEWIDFLDLNSVEFDSPDEIQQIMGTIMALYNNICYQFQNQIFRAINPDAGQTSDEEISLAKKH